MDPLFVSAGSMKEAYKNENVEAKTRKLASIVYSPQNPNPVTTFW